MGPKSLFLEPSHCGEARVLIDIAICTYLVRTAKSTLSPSLDTSLAKYIQHDPCGPGEIEKLKS